MSLISRFSLFFFLHSALLSAQSFDPAAGQPGSRAIPHDSPLIRSWATGIADFKRGYRNISNHSSGFATSGEQSNALGPALQNGTVSLGDSGFLTLYFPAPICNLPGPDFVVFENGFSDGFLELAFVEVSSNGRDFFTFPASSETPSTLQKGPFDTLDARYLHNLAGKYRAGFGTGFDLSDLENQQGLDVSAILFVRIRDAIGSVNPAFASLDAFNRPVNDPWPTDFESGGFDLDAVAAIHLSTGDAPLVWPSVLNPGDNFGFISPENKQLQLFSSSGVLMATFPSGQGNQSRLPPDIAAGIYYLRSEGRKSSGKIMVRQ